MVVLFSLVVISVAATVDPLQGLLSTALGLLLATVSTDPEYGTLRFTFGIIELSDGAAAGGKLLPAAAQREGGDAAGARQLRS